MKIDFGKIGPELTSSGWLDALALAPRALGGGARGSISVDLSAITWLGHLPLMAICLGMQEVTRANFDEQRIVMPHSPAVRAFLDRWRFYRFAREQGFLIETEPVDKAYGETTLGSTVLEIHSFDRMSEAEELRSSFGKADEHLRNILLTGAFLDEQEIEGLADLIVYELCKNAVEHAETDRAAVIFGRVSRDHDPARSVYEKSPAEWERPFFKSIRGEGMTELVIGDAGVGIISSLRNEAFKSHQITDPAEVLAWAFQPFSTRKRERAEHTRGLWAVKNKVRDLGGILYVRSGMMVGDEAKAGWSASWDFFHHPSKDRPTFLPDDAPFGGTQVQILLPHRMSRFTFVEYHRRTVAPQTLELETDELLVPAEPAPMALAEKIGTLPDRTVLFVDMSQMDSEKWTRVAVDEIGRQISDGLRRQNSRVWLLNPPDKVVQDLGASSWIVALWREQAILLPYARIGDSSKPPTIAFVISNPMLHWTDPGDTDAARFRLVQLIGQLAGAGQKVLPEKVADLQSDERNFVLHAIGTNQSLVQATRDGDGAFTAVLDVERLGRRAVASLLGLTLRQEVDQRLKKEVDEGRALWYRLPSQVYCRQYIDPHIITSLPPATADAMEKWIEDRIADTGATYAVSYTNFARYMLTRARRAGSIETLAPLRHYSSESVKNELNQIPPHSSVVILAGISGSGKTIIDTVTLLAQRRIKTSVVCVIDTTTASERHAVLTPMELRGEFHYRTRWEIEKYASIPAEERHLPIAIVDPETLMPVIQVPELPTRLRDGRFWRILSESEGVSVSAITYKGIDYTTMILTRNVLKHREAGDEIIEDFKTCFPKVRGHHPPPDIICCPKETMEVLSIGLMRRLRKEFRHSEFLTEDGIERSQEKKKFEGKRVVIFSAAATSGAGVARLQKYFQTAQLIHISVFVNRITDGLMVALTGSGERVSFTAFQRLVSGSPELRLGSSRSIAMPALLDYRASCLSNRLLLFVDELRREVGEPRVAQSPDELESVVQPEMAPHVRFDDSAVYSFGTADGMEALQALVRDCKRADERWLYGILDEVASRAEASLRNFQRESREWQRAYIDDLARLYRQAPDGDDVSARRAILEALLLHRWRWSEGRERTDADREPLGEADPPDDHSMIFAQELLANLSRASDPEFRTVVIRSISKVNRAVLIASLSKIIDIARQHRTTELTLALELTKILDDRVSTERLLDQLSKINADRARSRPAGRDEPFDIALSDLLADIGLYVADEEGGPAVRFLPWPAVRTILASEPPDHDRTIRLLIRSMRGRFGRNARFLYYRKEKEGNYAYGDAWPRRAVTDKRRIPEANIKAIELLEERDFFFSAQLGTDKRTQNYLRTLEKKEQETLKKLGMALFRIHLGDAVGLMRAWQNVDAFGPMDRDAVFDMDAAVTEAAALIGRSGATIRVIGDWQYEQMIDSLATRSDAAREHEALILFTERIRDLLGGDVASLLTLNDAGEWTREHLSGRARSHPLKFPNTGRDRLTVVVAEEKKGRIYSTIDEAAADGFVQRPAVPWAQSWFALPLVHGAVPDARCRAVIHIWHHIPGWFEQARNLLAALQSLGGTVVELSNAYAAAQEAWQRRTWEHDQTDRLSARLLNLALSAEALASESMEKDPRSGTLRTLVQTIREMQESLATFLDMREVRETAPVSQSLDTIVEAAVEDANNRYGEKLFSMIKREQVPTLQLRMEMMRRAIDELLKNAKSHVAPDEKVLVELMYDSEQGVVVLDVQNRGYGVPAERKERIFGMGSGLLLAKAAAETHGGTLEEVGEPGATAVFRMVLPVPHT